YRLVQQLRSNGRLTIRVNELMRPSGWDEAKLREIESWNIAPDEGDEWLRAGGMKLVLDGGFEGGWMRDPYAEPWGEHGTYFGVHADPGEYRAVVKALNRKGWRVATHAVGDAAIDAVLDAYEAANAERPIAAR